MQALRSTLVLLWLALAASRLPGAPPPGTVLRPADLLLDPRAVSYGSGWALALSASRPEWYTAGLARQVLEADGNPVAAPAGAPLPGVVGIRPGAWMVEPHGCTMDFVFTKDGAFLMGTAGHCVDGIGQHVVIQILAPGSNEHVLLDIGVVVARRDGGIGDDLALVALRPELSGWVSATTMVTGGPCGPYAGAGPELVAYYGQGLALVAGGTPREGLALRWEADHFGWTGPAISGDSGSPVIVLPDHEAAGNLTHLVVDALWIPSFVAGTRIQVFLEALAGLELSVSPVSCGEPPEGSFIRGDSNGDGTLDISDPIKTLHHLFSSADLPCQDAADADDSGTLEITDAVVLLSFLFLGGTPPPPPFPGRGPDPTPDPFPACR